jgi:hypothetical protein
VYVCTCVRGAKRLFYLWVREGMEREDDKGVPGIWELLTSAVGELPHDTRISTSGFGLICQHCFASPANMSRCGRCRTVQFCNEACQRAAWPRHKKTCCREFAASRAAWTVPSGAVDRWVAAVLRRILRQNPDIYGTLADAYCGGASATVPNVQTALGRGFFDWNSSVVKELDIKMRPIESARQREQGRSGWCGRWRTHVAVLSASDGTLLPHAKFHPCALLLAFLCARGVEHLPNEPFKSKEQLAQVLHFLNRPPRGATCDEVLHLFTIPGDYGPVPVEPCASEHADAQVEEGACWKGAMGLVHLFSTGADAQEGQVLGVPTVGNAAFVVDFSQYTMLAPAPAPAPAPVSVKGPAPAPASGTGPAPGLGPALGPGPGPAPGLGPASVQGPGPRPAGAPVPAGPVPVVQTPASAEEDQEEHGPGHGPGHGYSDCTVKVLLGLVHAVCRGPHGRYVDATVSRATADGRPVNMARQYLSLLPVAAFHMRITPPLGPGT